MDDSESNFHASHIQTEQSADAELLESEIKDKLKKLRMTLVFQKQASKIQETTSESEYEEKQAEEKEQEEEEHNLNPQKLLQDGQSEAEEQQPETKVEDLFVSKQPISLPRIKDIIWQPEGFLQKLQTLFQNLAEIILVILFAWYAICYPSYISFISFFMCSLLRFTIVQSLKIRHKNGLRIFTICLFLMIIIILVKIKVVIDFMGQEVKLEKKDMFLKEIKFHHSWGFKILCKNDVNCKAEALKNEYIFSLDGPKSFSLEILIIFLILILVYYFYSCQKQIDNLLYCNSKEDLLKFKKLEEDFKKVGSMEDSDDESKLLQTATHGNWKNLAKIVQRKKNKDQQDLEEFQKRIKKNYIESQYFYSFNKIFFKLTIACVIFGLVIRKQIIHVLTMIFLKLLFIGMSSLETKYQFQQRAFTFFFMDYVSYLALLRLIHDIIMSIDYNQIYFHQKENEKYKNKIEFIFGSLKFLDKSQQLSDQENLIKVVYFVSLLGVIFFSSCWKCCKWMEIREKTKEKEFKTRLHQLYWFIKIKSQEASLWEIKQILKKKVKREIKQKITKKEDFLYENKKKIKQMRQVSDQLYVRKLFVLNLTRINMFIIAYMYHSTSGLISLMWVLCTFILPQHLLALISIFCVYPLIILQFYLIYTIRVEVISKNSFLQHLAGYFQWDMKYESLEIIFMFFVTYNFIYLISLQYDCIQNKNKDKNGLLDFFKLRIQKNYSKKWQTLFLILKYIQYVMLASLFLQSYSQNFNDLQSLIYMTAFIIYTSSEYMYRKTGFILLWVFSFFIIVQYYMSLCYPYFMNDPNFVSFFYWCNFFPHQNAPSLQNQILQDHNTNSSNKEFQNEAFQNKVLNENPFKFSENQSIYFRLQPQLIDWIGLIGMAAVTEVNEMFKEEKAVHAVEEEVLQQFLDQKKELIYCYRRFQHLIWSLLIYTLVFIMIGMQLLMVETNLVTCIFFLLNSINIWSLIQGNQNKEHYKQTVTIFSFIKYFSAIILVLHVSFELVFGEMPGTCALDVQFQKYYPQLYSSLNLLGFRSLKYQQIRLNSQVNDQLKLQQQMSRKFFFFVLNFLISAFCEKYFSKRQQLATAEEDFNDETYKKLFEYEDQKRQEDYGYEELYASKVDQRGTRRVTQIIDDQFRQEEHMRMTSIIGNSFGNEEEFFNFNLQKLNKHDSEASYRDSLRFTFQQQRSSLPNAYKLNRRGSIYIKQDIDKQSYTIKTEYKKRDFFLFFEDIQYTTPFIVYRLIDYWNYLDSFAEYGHMINHFFIFYLAIFRYLSVYNFINLLYIVIFYVIMSYKTRNRGIINKTVSGLQSQCDLKMAQLITKRHKTEVLSEFLHMRIKVWKLQSITFFIMLLIGYPTTILNDMRKQKLNEGSSVFDPIVQALNTSIFWSFFFGFYNDNTEQNKTTFFLDAVIILFALFIEKNCINWLENRFGCNYFRLQKFIELEIRYKAARENWEVKSPTYSTERYRAHYFQNDFDEIKERFDYISYDQIQIEKKNQEEEELFPNLDKNSSESELVRKDSFIHSSDESCDSNFEQQQFFEQQRLTLQIQPKDSFEIQPKNNFSVLAQYGERQDIQKQSPNELDEKPQVRIRPRQLLRGPSSSYEEKPQVIYEKPQDLKLTLSRQSWLPKFLPVSNKEQIYKKSLKGDFIPLKVARRIYETVKFTVELDCRCPDLQIDQELAQILNEDNLAEYDYEGVPILRKYKLEQLRKLLQEKIDFKYNISFARGKRMMIQNLIMFLLMISIVLRSDFYSLVYIVFLFRFNQVQEKELFFIKISGYMAAVILMSYLMLLLNFRTQISPKNFPEPFGNYPDCENKEIKVQIVPDSEWKRIKFSVYWWT